MSQIDDPEREDAQMIEEAMQNTLTPEAVAAIAYIMRGVVTDDQAVNRQIRWFTETLTELAGGGDEVDRVAEEFQTRIG